MTDTAERAAHLFVQVDQVLLPSWKPSNPGYSSKKASRICFASSKVNLMP